MPTQLSFIVDSETQLTELANQLIAFCENRKIICFDAPMGAGKTTFIKSLCKQLGYTGIVNSPTYPIISVYPGDPIIYHLDCYRLKDEEEAIQIGVEDYLYSGNYCLIEWPSLIKKMVPLKVVMVTIELIGTHQRKFIFQK